MMHQRATLLLLALCCASGCARRLPFVVVHPSTSEGADVALATSAPSLVEARPSGLVISLREPKISAPWRTIALLRQVDDQATGVLHTIAPSDEQRERLRADGLSLFDQGVQDGSTYTYVTALYDEQDEMVWRSEPSTITWRTPPEPPEELKVTALGRVALSLTWRPRPGWGVLILRRTLGQSGSPVRRLAHVKSGMTYVDREVAPGQGYAYRVAYIQETPGRAGTIKTLGLPGMEVYATIPAR